MRIGHAGRGINYYTIRRLGIVGEGTLAIVVQSYLQFLSSFAPPSSISPELFRILCPKKRHTVFLS